MLCGAACLIVPLAIPRPRRRSSFRSGVDRISPSPRSSELPPPIAFIHWRPLGGFSPATIWIYSIGVDLRLALGVLEQLGGSEMALHVSYVSAMEDIRDARAGLPRLPAIRAGVFRNVCHGRLARRMGEESQMTYSVAPPRCLHIVLSAGADRWKGGASAPPFVAPNEGALAPEARFVCLWGRS